MPSAFDFDGQAEIVAHRGYSAEAPENTIVAIRMALEAGADAVEFDLHTAGDGVPVLLHDETLSRTTNARGRVTEFTAEELAELDAGSWFDAAFAGEPVPTVAEAMLALAPSRVRVYAEIKGARREEDLDGLVAVVRNAEMLERTVFISMDWGALERVRTAEPDALVGYIVDKSSRVEEAFERAGGDARAMLDFDARILQREPHLVRRAAEHGIPLACWTVDDPDDAGRLLRLGVPRITTNRVNELLAWKRGLS